MSKLSQREIGANLLRALGVDPDRCKSAEIILRIDEPIMIKGEFYVVPRHIDKYLQEFKTELKEFTLVEIKKDDPL